MKYRSEYFKKYREENREKIRQINKDLYYAKKDIILERKKEYNKENKQKNSIQKKKYYIDNKELKKKYYDDNKESISINKKEYYKKNREVLIKRNIIYSNIKYKKDILFRISSCIRSLIRQSLKNNGHNKNLKTSQILGCSFLDFKNHLEKQFQPWMNWENYGLYNGTLNYGWDIDHIIGLKNGKSEEEIIKLNHFSNLQPMCSYYNRYIKR
jgi:hypothetical protein